MCFTYSHIPEKNIFKNIYCDNNSASELPMQYNFAFDYLSRDHSEKYFLPSFLIFRNNHTICKTCLKVDLISKVQFDWVLASFWPLLGRVTTDMNRWTSVQDRSHVTENIQGISVSKMLPHFLLNPLLCLRQQSYNLCCFSQDWPKRQFVSVS